MLTLLIGKKSVIFCKNFTHLAVHNKQNFEKMLLILIYFITSKTQTCLDIDIKLFLLSS